MPTLRNTSRCEAFRPLLVLKATMTTPTLFVSGNPASFALSVGLRVAACVVRAVPRIRVAIIVMANFLRIIFVLPPVGISEPGSKIFQCALALDFPVNQRAQIYGFG